MEDRVETSNLQIHSFSSSLQSCMWAWKTLHPRKRPSFVAKKKKKNAKMTVETVETVVAAAPYAALIGHKLRPLLSDSQSALADCEENVIQICHLLSRNGKLSLVRLTKSFPTIPNLRGIANSYQNDERFKMWSVMLLCTIPEALLCCSTNPLAPPPPPPIHTKASSVMNFHHEHSHNDNFGTAGERCQTNRYTTPFLVISFFFFS